MINHALKNVLKKKKEFDYFVLLQGTSPLRTSQHIDKAIMHYFKESKNDNQCTLVFLVLNLILNSIGFY